jgi:hypothetical protein
MKQFLLSALFISVLYIDFIDSKTDPSKSIVVVTYDNGIVDNLVVDKQLLYDGKVKQISAEAMKMINKRTGAK